MFSALLIVFALLGVLLAASGVFVAAQTSNVKSGGKLVEYRKITLISSPFVSDYMSTNGYSTLTAFARVISPTNSLAIVTIYGSRDGKSNTEIQRIDSQASSWARWQHRVTYPQIRVKVEGPLPGTTIPAAQADVLIYLDP